jgi:uncharacterized Zn finger protein
MFEDIIYVYNKKCPNCNKVGKVIPLKEKYMYQCENCGTKFRSTKLGEK